MQFLVNNIEVEIKKGDITEECVDAIVNAANNRLWMGGGVAGAIKRKGGSEIENEAVTKGPVKTGEAVLTTAGKLKAKYVIHAAVMGQDLRTDAQKIALATESALRCADTAGATSIAFPALGTGVGGFDYTACAQIMLSQIEKFRAKNIRRIVFVLYSDEAFEAFLNVAREKHG